MHDRRPKNKFENGKYRSLWQSSDWETLKELADTLCAKWQAEEDTGITMDDFTMCALKRTGRIQGIRMLLKEIERLANSDF